MRGWQVAGDFQTILDVSKEFILDKSPIVSGEYDSHALVDADEVLQARQMSTQIFLRHGKLSAEDLDDQGVPMNDPTAEISNFFGVYRGDTLLATNRLIWAPDATVDDLRLPTESIDEEYCEYLRGHAPGKIAEIGTLAKARGTSTVAMLKLLKSMWTFAGERDIDTFVCGLEPKIYPHFQNMFGDSLVNLTTDEHTVQFPGIHGDQVPLMIDVKRATALEENSAHRSVGQAIGRFIIGRYITSDAPGMIRRLDKENRGGNNVDSIRN